MQAHKFRIGEIVRLVSGRFPDHTGAGVYEITRLMPAAGGQLGYRIKSAHESHERAVQESEITSALRE
jgi:hypothetical protein